MNLKKIWNDPVWSKIISVIIIAIFTLIYKYVDVNFSKDYIVKFLNLWINEILYFGITLSTIIVVIFFMKHKKNKNLKNCFDDVTIETIFEQPKLKEKYNEDSKNLDIILFNRIRNEYLSADKEISWLREQNFNFGFNRNNALVFFDIHDKIGNNPNFEFLNTELETARKELFKNIENFNNNLSVLTFPEGKFVQSVPKEWKFNFPEKYEKSAFKLNESRTKLIDSYDNLIRLGRNILKV